MGPESPQFFYFFKKKRVFSSLGCQNSPDFFWGGYIPMDFLNHRLFGAPMNLPQRGSRSPQGSTPEAHKRPPTIPSKPTRDPPQIPASPQEIPHNSQQAHKGSPTNPNKPTSMNDLLPVYRPGGILNNRRRFPRPTQVGRSPRASVLATQGQACCRRARAPATWGRKAAAAQRPRPQLLQFCRRMCQGRCPRRRPRGRKRRPTLRRLGLPAFVGAVRVGPHGNNE